MQFEGNQFRLLLESNSVLDNVKQCFHSCPKAFSPMPPAQISCNKMIYLIKISQSAQPHTAKSIIRFDIYDIVSIIINVPSEVCFYTN